MKTLGIDLGGTQIKLGVVENGGLLHESECATPEQRSYDTVLQTLAEEANKLLSRYPEIRHVGLGSPGLVDAGAGMILYSNNFGWHNVPLGCDLSAVLGRPVRMANDAHCAALGEALHGAGKGVKRMAMVTIGTGLGGGFVKNGVLEEDAYGSLAYIFGHISVEQDGRLCNCGRRGCLECYASAGAIAQKSKRIAHAAESVREVFEAAKRQDAVALSIVGEFMEYLASGVVSIANMLRPHIVVIGGGVAGSCDMILPYLNEELQNGVYGYQYAPVRAVCAELGNRAGVVGAASL